jgi:hypothetical protein
LGRRGASGDRRRRVRAPGSGGLVAGIKADPALAGDNLKNLPIMASEDLATNIAATRAFVHGCFSRQPTADDFELPSSPAPGFRSMRE